MPSQVLERRGHLGLVLDRAQLEIKRVVPGSSAHLAGLEPGDRLTHIEHNPVYDLDEVRLISRSLRSGAALLLGVERRGRPLVLESQVVPFPLEEHPGARVVLDAVAVGGHLLRVYAVVPETPGPHPVVQYLPGAHWASEEYPLTPTHPLPALADALVRVGWAMVRVERSGLGDSQGPPCTRVDFEGELLGHAAGLTYLARTSWVDSRRIVLFGYSLGAMLAPLLASRAPIAGIATFGASRIPISEALAGAIVRYAEGQQDAGARPWANKVSELIRLVVQERRTPADVFAERRDLARIAPAHFAGDQAYHRVVSFYHQLEDQDIAAAWRDWHGPVLLMHGAKDAISTAEDSQVLAASLGERAEFVELPGVDHQMSDAGVAGAATLAPGVARTLVAWLAGSLRPDHEHPERLEP